VSPLITDLIVFLPESALNWLLIPRESFEESVFISVFDFLFNLFRLILKDVKPFGCCFLSGCFVTALFLRNALRECIVWVSIEDGSAGLALSLLDESRREDTVIQVAGTCARQARIERRRKVLAWRTNLKRLNRAFCIYPKECTSLESH
jgi:hypothetical protein